MPYNKAHYWCVIFFRLLSNYIIILNKLNFSRLHVHIIWFGILDYVRCKFQSSADNSESDEVERMWPPGARAMYFAMYVR